MALYDEFRFKPAPWLPHSDLPFASWHCGIEDKDI